MKASSSSTKKAPAKKRAAKASKAKRASEQCENPALLIECGLPLCSFAVMAETLPAFVSARPPPGQDPLPDTV